MALESVFTYSKSTPHTRSDLTIFCSSTGRQSGHTAALQRWYLGQLTCLILRLPEAADQTTQLTILVVARILFQQVSSLGDMLDLLLT